MILDGNEHVVGDVACTMCWNVPGRHYPRPCNNEADDGTPCPGLMHASFGDENYFGQYWLYTRCDVCGEPE